jgi:serine/threonine-protein kinase
VSTQNYIVGTLAYVAPEQIEGRGTNFRSEIFSFGIILYELLTGSNPFRAEHHMSLLYNIAHENPEPLEKHVKDCPPALALFVTRCLEKQPERRPADMQEVETTLTEILAGLELGDTAFSRSPLPALPIRSSTRNPYLNRVMIRRREDFFGRTQEIKRIFARLNANPPGSISVLGDRKIGKSSLLNHIYARQSRLEHLEQPDHMVMVFLDLQEEKKMSMAQLVTKLLGVATLELRGRLDVADCAPSLDGVKDLVQRLDGAGFRLALLLDEFDSVTTNPNFDLEFFSFLRFLANHYNVAYITSSARDLQTLCHTREISDSPFFNIFSTMRLTVFTHAEAAELIRVPSERVGKPLAAHAGAIVDMAGHFPFFLQMACSHAIDWLEDNPGKQTPDFDAVRRAFYEEAVFHYRGIWDGFDAHERSAVRRLAEGRSIPDALRHVLDELGSKHYVEPSDGKLRLFASTFQEFVRTLPGKASKSSFVRRLLGGRES